MTRMTDDPVRADDQEPAPKVPRYLADLKDEDERPRARCNLLNLFGLLGR
jgi:hypothetical protein